MGNVQDAPSVFSLHEEQMSAAEPGSRCVRSMRLDALDPPMTLDQLFEEILFWQRYPVFSGMPGYAFVKHVERHEDAPNDFTVKVLFDGKKLDAAGKGRGDGVDKVAIWRRMIFASIAINAGSMPPQLWTKRCTVLNFVLPIVGAWVDEASDEQVVSQVVWYGVLQPEVAVEICRDVNGVRDASAQFVGDVSKRCDYVYQAWLRAWTASIWVSPRGRCIREPGTLSNVSETMDEHFTYEELWESLVPAVLKQVGCRCDDTSEGSCVGQAWQPEVHSCTIRSEVEFSRATGEIRLLQFAVSGDGGPSWPAWSRLARVVVHREPLVAESWLVDEDGRHVSNLVGARWLQALLNGALDSSFVASWPANWAE